MHRFRQIALAILFAGWMIPAFMAQWARERAPQGAARLRPPVGRVGGFATPDVPTPAEQVASMLTTIATLWFLIALAYVVVLTVRFRRTLVG